MNARQAATTAPHDAIPDLEALARSFGTRPDISARSVLVTIFGDSVVPVGGAIWLGDLIELCEPFGFNDRLVRTSMFRLSSEGWFDTERVGRRSRYQLTTTATDAFAAAEARIYHAPRTHWDGRWTLAFIDRGEHDRQDRDTIAAALRTEGYGALSAGTLAAPRHDSAAAVRQALERAGVDPSLSATVPVAAARFEDLRPLLEGGWAAAAFGLDLVRERYHDFLLRYRWTAALGATTTLGDAAGFLGRTMLVHDLRRARLADPDLPAELLPDGWPVADAVELAAAAYRHLSPGTWRWLRQRTDPAAVTWREPTAGPAADRFA